MTIDFSEWNLAATLDTSSFVFDPPKDSEQVTMKAVEDANVATDNAEKGGTK